jgi:hypothetical protein
LAESVFGGSAFGRQPEGVGEIVIVSLGIMHGLKAAEGISTQEGICLEGFLNQAS